MGLFQEAKASFNALVGGSGVRIRRYPNLAVGVTLTSDGVAYVYPVGANVKAFVAAATITSNWRYFAICPFTPSAAATEYFVLLGASTGAGGILTAATSLIEVVVPAITVATGQFRNAYFPYCATVIADGVNDAAVGGMCTTNGAADTMTCGVAIATLFGT